MIRYADNYCNPKLYHIWAQNSGEAIDWYQDRLEEAGFVSPFEGAKNAKPSLYKHWATSHIPSWPADAEFAGLSDVVNGKIVLGDYAKSKGVDFRFQLFLMVRPVQDESREGDGRHCEISDGYDQISPRVRARSFARAHAQ